MNSNSSLSRTFPSHYPQFSTTTEQSGTKRRHVFRYPHNPQASDFKCTNIITTPPSAAHLSFTFFTAFHFHLDKEKKAQVIHVYKKIQPHHIVILRISRHTNTAFRARAFNALHDCSSGSGKRGKVSASAR